METPPHSSCEGSVVVLFVHVTLQQISKSREAFLCVRQKRRQSCDEPRQAVIGLISHANVVIPQQIFASGQICQRFVGPGVELVVHLVEEDAARVQHVHGHEREPSGDQDGNGV